MTPRLLAHPLPSLQEVGQAHPECWPLVLRVCLRSPTCHRPVCSILLRLLLPKQLGLSYFNTLMRKVMRKFVTGPF